MSPAVVDKKVGHNTPRRVHEIQDKSLRRARMSSFLSCRRGSVHVARTDGRRGRRLNAGRTERRQRGAVEPLVVGVTTTNFGDESKDKCETVNM